MWLLSKQHIKFIVYKGNVGLLQENVALWTRIRVKLWPSRHLVCKISISHNGTHTHTHTNLEPNEAGQLPGQTAANW